MKKIIAIVAAFFIAVSAFAGTGITGFLPQKSGFKQNFTPDEIADYAFQGAKPDITPSNKFWSDNYDVYASYLKDQIMTWMAAETGNTNISEAQAEAKFRKMPTRKATGTIKATGLSINQATGEILGLAQPIERAPYETIDGLGEYEIYGKAGVMSCVCCNTHIGIEAKQNEDSDEWEDEATASKPAPKKNVDSKKFNVPAGSEIVINNYNYAYGGDANAKADSKSEAKNEAPKTAYYDANEDPQPIIRKKPKVVYEEEEDDYTTTVVKKKKPCNGCSTASEDDDKWKEKMLRNARANTVANYLVPFGAAALGSYLNGKFQKAPVNNYNTNNNYYTEGSTDNGGDGGNLPTNTPTPTPTPDPNGDGGNLPTLR